MEVQGCACPIYMEAWCNMMSERDRAKSDAEKLHIYANFAEKYTMLSHFWSKFKNGLNEINRKEFRGWYNHLYCPTRFEDDKHIEFPQSHASTLTFCLVQPAFRKHFYYKAEECLKFPHEFLDKIYYAYMESSPKPITKETKLCYQKNKDLYSRMINCEENIDEWLKCVEEIEDKEAAMANFELKLGQGGNWTIKKIWDAYFKFLKENNRIEILEIYRKYTRLFICDKEAVEAYRNEIEKFSSWNEKTAHFWIDTIKYEKDFGDLKFAYRLLENAVKAILGKNVKPERSGKQKLEEYIELYNKQIEKAEVISLRYSIEKFCDRSDDEIAKLWAAAESRKNSIFFSKNNLIEQILPFRRSFIQHLLKSANGFVLRKLYGTCKFFFLLQSTPLCYLLEICDHFNNEIFEEALSLKSDEALACPALENLYIYGKLFIQASQNRRLLSNVCSKISRCDASFIKIYNQDISLNEYKFLLSPNLFHCYFCDVNICENDGRATRGGNILELAKSCTNLKFFEAVGYYYFIAFCTDKCYTRLSMTEETSFTENEFYFVFLEEQDLSIDELNSFLVSAKLEVVILQNVSVKDGEDNLMEKKAVIDFVKEHVPSKTFVNIF